MWCAVLCALQSVTPPHMPRQRDHGANKQHGKAKGITKSYQHPAPKSVINQVRSEESFSGEVDWEAHIVEWPGEGDED